MQTATQSQFSTQMFNPNLYMPYGGLQQSTSRIGGFDNGRNAFNPMSQMANNFSRTSYSFSGQTTENGKTSSFSGQMTVTNRGPSINQMGNGFGGNGALGYFGRPGSGAASHVPQLPPMQQCGCNQSGRMDQTQWSDTGVSNNKSSIDLGNYKLDFDKSNSSMLVTDKKTGDQTKVQGDPHLEQHANSANKTSDMFNGTMTFQLPDSTKITVGTQASKSNPKVSFADNVTITKGNQAYQVSGLSQQNSKALSVQKSNNGRALDAATPDGYTVVANRNGTGFIDPTTGKQPTATDLKKAG